MLQITVGLPWMDHSAATGHFYSYLSVMSGYKSHDCQQIVLHEKLQETVINDGKQGNFLDVFLWPSAVRLFVTMIHHV